MTSSEILIPMSTSTLYDDLCCIPAQYFFSFRCLTQFDVLECISAVFRMQSVLMIWILYSWKLWLLNLYYTHLFNTVLTKSTFPEHWKQTKILPIPKTHNEFRPIVILPFLSKVMKNIMARKITYYLESQNYFILSQSGLMKGRSCTTALINIVEDLRSQLDGNSVAFLGLLNHTRAFDTVDHEVLLKKLRKLFYFSNSACNLICSYLLNWFKKVHLNGNISDPLNISGEVNTWASVVLYKYLYKWSTKCFSSQ